MLRFIIKGSMYFLVLLCCVAIGLLSPLGIGSVLLLAAVLAAVNTLIRPVLVAIALPFNFITLGVASVFANLLTLVIANAIVGGLIASGFWIMLLIAFVIMLADDTIRNIRQAIRKRMAAENN